MYKNRHNDITVPIIFSPSDLVQFMYSHFASYMDRLEIEKPDTAIQPDEEDMLSLLSDNGMAHQEELLATFTEHEFSIVY